MQSIPLHDVSHCHGDCFDRMQVILSSCQKAFYLSFIYLDEFIWAPLPESELLPEMTLYIRKIISMALFAKHLLFSSFGELHSFSLKPQLPTPLISLGCYINLNFLATFEPSCLVGSHRHLIKFFLVNLSCISSIVRPAKKSRRKEGKFFLPL